MYAFAKKLKELDPTFIVTQPVFGSPQVTEENYMVNTCWADGATSPVDAIGIMVYQGTGSLQYVDNYVHGSTQWRGFPHPRRCAIEADHAWCRWPGWSRDDHNFGTSCKRSRPFRYHGLVFVSHRHSHRKGWQSVQWWLHGLLHSRC